MAAGATTNTPRIVRIDVKPRIISLGFSIPLWKGIGSPDTVALHRVGVGPVRILAPGPYPVKNETNRPHIVLSPEDYRRWRLGPGLFPAGIEHESISFTPPPPCFNFEVFRGQRKHEREPGVRILKTGAMRLNARAHQLLRSAPAIQLLYDAEQQMIALQASEGGTTGKSYTVAVDHTAAQIIPRGFFAAYNLVPADLAGHYPVQEYESMLLIDLLAKIDGD